MLRSLFKKNTIVAIIFLFSGISNIHSQENIRNDSISKADSIAVVSISAKFNPRSKHNKITLTTNDKKSEIHYTLDGSEPTVEKPVFTRALQLFGNGIVKAAAFKNGERITEIDSIILVNHKAVGIKPEFSVEYGQEFNGGGKYGLTDGIRGGKNFNDGLWQRVKGGKFEFILDLKLSKLISKVTLGVLECADSSIYFPERVVLSGSQDGMEFKTVAELRNQITTGEGEIKLQDFSFQKRFKARFIKISAEIFSSSPESGSTAEKNIWILADEIIVK